MKEVKFYKCENGKTYISDKNLCLFCNHCSGVFYDSHGPYFTTCGIDSDNDDYKCKHFIIDTDIETKVLSDEEFNTMIEMVGRK